MVLLFFHEPSAQRPARLRQSLKEQLASPAVDLHHVLVGVALHLRAVCWACVQDLLDFIRAIFPDKRQRRNLSVRGDSGGDFDVDAGHNNRHLLNHVPSSVLSRANMLVNSIPCFEKTL